MENIRLQSFYGIEVKIQARGPRHERNNHFDRSTKTFEAVTTEKNGLKKRVANFVTVRHFSLSTW